MLNFKEAIEQTLNWQLWLEMNKKDMTPKTREAIFAHVVHNTVKQCLGNSHNLFLK